MTDLTHAVPQDPIRRYSNTAVAFHWLTVLLVLAQAALGFTFVLTEGPDRAGIFAWHKTIGALILVITLARLFYRLRNPPPPYSPDLPRWERVLGAWNHRLFYALLILMPLSGLTAVSGRTDGPFTHLVAGIPLPVIPGVSKDLGDSAGGIHEVLAFILIAFILLHVLAALKHRFVDRVRDAGRMPPFTVPNGAPAVVGQGAEARPV